MGYLPDINNLIPEGYRITRRHTVVFLAAGDCQRCGNAVELRFKVRDRLGETGYVCGICAWMVSLGMALQAEATCRRCSCSDSAACPTGCWWVELDRAAGIGLCSNCAAEGSA